MVSIVFRTVAFAVLLIAVALGSASAQEQQAAASQQRNQPGQFDFYVLSLSWSPSFCKDTEERGRQSNEQCRGRPYSFVVHGLWPQYERGFPRDCQVPAPRLNRETHDLDARPDAGAAARSITSGTSTAPARALRRRPTSTWCERRARR